MCFSCQQISMKALATFIFSSRQATNQHNLVGITVKTTLRGDAELCFLEKLRVLQSCFD